MPVRHTQGEGTLQGVTSPPQDNQGSQDDLEEHHGSPSDTTTHGDTDNGFQSEESLSSQNGDDTPEDNNIGYDPESTTDKSNPVPSNGDTQESGAPSQEGPGDDPGEETSEIGRASCRERV